MGQKTNPAIFRLGITKTWKTEFFEKKSNELRIYSYKDLAIKSFIERFLETQDLMLHDYKLHYSGSTLNIYISYFVTSKIYQFDRQITNENISIEPEKNAFNSFLKKDIRKPVIKKFISWRNNPIYRKILISLKTKKRKKPIYLKVTSMKKVKKYFRNNYNTLLLPSQTFQNIDINSKKVISEKVKMLKSLSLYTKNQFNIFLTFRCVNKNFYLTSKQTQSLKEKFMLLQKFKNSIFFKESMNILFATVHYKNSANLLSKFIAFQFKKIKRHKFFLAFLQKTLTLFVNSNFSQVKGVKIMIKGRLNGAPRAKHKILTIGSVPVQTIISNLDYAQSTCNNSNGSYGIKIWVIEKSNIK